MQFERDGYDRVWIVCIAGRIRLAEHVDSKHERTLTLTAGTNMTLEYPVHAVETLSLQAAWVYAFTIR